MRTKNRLTIESLFIRNEMFVRLENDQIFFFSIERKIYLKVCPCHWSFSSVKVLWQYSSCPIVNSLKLKCSISSLLWSSVKLSKNIEIIFVLFINIFLTSWDQWFSTTCYFYFRRKSRQRKLWKDKRQRFVIMVDSFVSNDVFRSSFFIFSEFFIWNPLIESIYRK